MSWWPSPTGSSKHRSEFPWSLLMSILSCIGKLMETGKGQGLGLASNLQKALYNPWGVELVAMCKMLDLPNTANIKLMWLINFPALTGCFPKTSKRLSFLRIVYEAATCPSFSLCALFSLSSPPQLRQSRDWEAVGRKLVRVLDQDGVLLGLSVPLHVDPHRSHGLPQALWSLGRPPRLLGFSGTRSAAATLNRGVSADPLYSETQPCTTLSTQNGALSVAFCFIPWCFCFVLQCKHRDGDLLLLLPLVPGVLYFLQICIDVKNQGT